MERQEKDLDSEILDEKVKKPPRHMEAGRGKDGEPSVDALRRWFIWAGVALVICLAFVLGGAALTSGKNKVEEAILEIDGGPVVVLRLNRKGTVLSASGLNDAGRRRLRGKNIDNSSLEEAIDFLISSFAEMGHLENTGAVFITVRSASEDSRANLSRLVERAALYAETALIKRQAGVKLYTGEIHMDSAVEDLVNEYRITPGKAALVKSLVDKNVRLKLEDRGRLAAMETGDIVKEMERNKYSTSFTSVTIKTSYVEKETTEEASDEATEESEEVTSEPETTEESESSTEETAAPETTRARAKAATTAAPAATAPPAPTPAETPAPEPAPVPETPVAETVMPPVETPQTQPQTEPAPTAPEETPAPPVNLRGPGFAPEDPGPQPEQTPSPLGPGA